MDIDTLTFGEMKQIRALLGGASAYADHPYKLGSCYLVETVTKFWLGKLVGITPGELVLDQASWIPDTGRYNEALKNGTANEVEPVEGEVIIGRGSIVDVVVWNKPLLRAVK